MTQPNPFNGSDSLKGVIDAVSQVIGGQPVVPDTYNTHIDAAAEELGKIDGPVVSDDLTKIMQKHFNAGSDGKPQATELQKAFEREVGKKMQQDTAAGKWKEH